MLQNQPWRVSYHHIETGKKGGVTEYQNDCKTRSSQSLKKTVFKNWCQGLCTSCIRGSQSYFDLSEYKLKFISSEFQENYILIDI
jgi:hypothetical protein